MAAVRIPQHQARERILGLHVGARQWAGLGMTAAGLVLLGVSLPAVHGAHARFSVPGMIMFETFLLAAGTLLILGPLGEFLDEHGLDDIDRNLMLTIIKKYSGGPVGLNTIAASLSEDEDAIEEIYEPYLMQLRLEQQAS